MADGAVAGTVTLNEQFEIDAGKPLPELDSPGGQAFAARSIRGGSGRHFALLCKPSASSRRDTLEALKNFGPSSMIRLVDHGVVRWPDRHHRLTLVFDRPAGPRVMNALEEPIRAWDVEEVTTRLLQPVLPVLRELSNRNVTHRAIRPTNMFLQNPQGGPIMLGECLSHPPAFDQAAFLEPIESAMCNPAGRGDGTVADDLYSLGAAMLVLLLGRNPVAGMNPHALISAKINQGSYGALVGSYRLSLEAMEPLRGLLSDDLRERWTLKDLDFWLAGRRLTPKQSKLPPRATRPLHFGGEDHFNVRSLANALARDWRQAATVIRSTNFENWLRRTLSAEELLDHLVKAIGPTGTGQDNERMVARACIVLDPTAPMRYRDVSATLLGLGPLMAMNVNNQQVRQATSEMLAQRLPGMWLATQPAVPADTMKISGVFEKLSSYVENFIPGFGFERCLYELNPYLPCRSPILESYYVLEIKQILPALEEAAAAGDHQRSPVDRHTAAFLAARSRTVTENWLRPLGHAEGTTEHLVGVVRLLAMLQQSEHKAPLPELSRWLAALLEPAIAGYHNLKTQKRLRADVEKAVSSGNIIELLKLFDDPSALERDRKGFEQAKVSYARTATQIRSLDGETSTRDQMAQSMGEQIAAVTAGTASAAGSLVIVMYYLL